MNDFLSDLQARGLLHDMSAPSHKDWPTLETRLNEKPITAYVGFDPSADSMHVGHLLQMLALMRLQRAGHTPIAVVGGGTGLIGDPSFKATERKMLSTEHVEANVAGLRVQMEQYLDFSDDRPNKAVLLNNADWLCKANLVEFLRDIGKHFSIGQMVARDSVKQRLEGREHGISFTEFSYALMQAYDFLMLFDEHGCELQVGGSDQWGNILDGMNLIRRLRQRPSWGFTQPLITKADGTKFGKTETGTVWLDPDRTSPFQFFQYWRNCSDQDVGNYLRYFTFMPIPEIERLEAEVARAPQERAAQQALADEMTRFVHGQEALDGTHRATKVLFQGGDFRSLSEAELRSAFQDTPSTALDRGVLGSADAGLPALVAASGLESSRGRARKAIESGAISVNGIAEKDPTRVIGAEDLLPGGYLVLRRGKKTYHVVSFA